MAIPEDHLAKFHKMTDAKEMWEAIIYPNWMVKNNQKKTQKYILKQQFKGFSVSNSEGLHKGYDRFQSLLSQLDIHGIGVSTEDAKQKFFRVFETDVKGSTGSSFSAQNVAFVYFESTSSTNDVSTAYDATTSSGYNSQRENSSSYTDELMHSIFANQSSGHFARECRLKGNQDIRRRDAGNTGYKEKDNRRRPGKQEEPKALITLDGDGVDWTGHAEDEQENFALMAYSHSGSNTEVTSCSKECEESYAKLKKLYDEQREQLGDASIEIKAYTVALAKLTDSMNYQLVTAENKANKTAGPKEANNSAGTQDYNNAGNSEMKAEPAQEYFVLPLWSFYTSTIKSSEAKNGGENLMGILIQRQMRSQ
ncbi:hypothetical protein Tco_0471826 [Tanacetum coccineum]